MSPRVYLSQPTYQTTPEEDTPVCLSIQLSRATVKALHRRLQEADRHEDMRWVRRTPVWIDRLVHDVPGAVWCERWGRRPACL